MRYRDAVTPAIAAVALAVTLSGCTASVSRTVSPEAFEGVVIEALQQIADAEPEVDCGNDQIAIVDGDEVHCDINTAGYDTIYDSVVTISTDNGDDYHIDVEVDEQPKK